MYCNTINGFTVVLVCSGLFFRACASAVTVALTHRSGMYPCKGDADRLGLHVVPADSADIYSRYYTVHRAVPD